LSVYADSSLFVSLYLPDRHFKQAQRLAAQHTRVWLTPLHRAELANSAAQQLFMKEISAAQAQRALKDFQRDRESRFWMEVDLPEMTFDRCVQLAQQYGSRVALRTSDTLHVASALELGAERFWTFDERQAKLARAAGLKIS
jgi:predicted nucleic acid-binding protein